MTEPFTPPAPLRLEVVGQGAIEFTPRTLVIAGYTARDRAEAQRHIDELEKAGIAPPAAIPTFYSADTALLSTEARIHVRGTETSGEVEPVLFCTASGWYVGVGSDHTDRALERDDVAQSKQACPKPVASRVLPYELVKERWDDLTLRSWTGAERVPYQDGLAASLMTVPDLLAELRSALGAEPEELVLFLGTVPLAAPAFVFSDRYALELASPNGMPPLELTYDVAVRRDP